MACEQLVYKIITLVYQEKSRDSMEEIAEISASFDSKETAKSLRHENRVSRRGELLEILLSIYKAILKSAGISEQSRSLLNRIDDKGSCSSLLVP